MAKNTQPIAKRAKALGISPAAMGYFKKETNRNMNTRTRRKKSEYGTQLQEKQKVKFIYGVLEKQFHGYYEKAVRMPGKAGDNLLIQLECRLDNVIFRLGLAATRREARQMVSHGHFTVDGKNVNIPSFQVRPGMVIALKESSRSIARFAQNLERNSFHPVPRWLDFNAETMVGQVLAVPTREEIDLPVEEHLIVELYSK